MMLRTAASTAMISLNPNQRGSNGKTARIHRAFAG